MNLLEFFLLGFFPFFKTVFCAEEDFGIELSQMSDFSRSMSSQSASVNNPVTPIIKRRFFPEQNPHVCLAFLSCCKRTDLLNHTLSAAIRHMEEDEPKHLRYEIAWVDNGSGSESIDEILDSYQIDKALPLDQNTGLAFGMNLLIQNLCTAPYILLLEEDWLYLDELVTEQTEYRKAAITTAIAFTEMNYTSYDKRQVMGVFLRPETYSAFMRFPFLDIWQEANVNLLKLPPHDQDKDCKAEPITKNINFQIACADPSISSKYIWGSYTNGAGLYRRSDLLEIGRMFGEPGDAFHDRYVESNYAYRVGLQYCHAAIQLGECQDLSSSHCTAAFHHIGGGRGTRPMKATNFECASPLWTFVGTPMFHRYRKLMGSESEMCSKEKVKKLKELKAKEQDAAEYRREVEEMNNARFEEQKIKRAEMVRQAQLIRESDRNLIRQHIDWMSKLTDEEILQQADKLERLARSPHPLEGYWDSHGRPLK